MEELDVYREPVVSSPDSAIALPPQHIEAERHVLGAMLMSSEGGGGGAGNTGCA